MCGIVGIMDITGQREIDKELLNRMNQTQVHRGPDGGGLYSSPGIGLGHRRLSIIDISGGHQPLFNEDYSIVVVYNGEIYNYSALAEELKKCGHVFRTHSDTEVIVHAWEEWGEDCVKHFRGMFSFAIWDSGKRTLFLARDRMGIKPLYYTFLSDGHLAFSSELKALMVHPGVFRELDTMAVEDYFSYGYIPEPRTILKNVRKLPPGYILTISSSNPKAEPIQYWDVPFLPQSSISEEEAAEELVERLREAVKIRLVSEVPLGAFLSGGVDSSAVVSMMAQLSKEPVNTCTISFGEPKFNESQYANQVSKLYQTKHHIEQVDADDFCLIDKLAEIYDEPYADSSAIPTYRVCSLAKKTVTVALSGDGGDENLAGYRRYRWHTDEERIRSLLPQSVRGPIFQVLAGLYPNAEWVPSKFRAKSTLQAISRDTMEGYFHSITLLGGAERDRLFNQSFKKKLGGYKAIEVLKMHAKAAPAQDPLSRIQYVDMKTYLVGDILTKVDRASMANSLEVRVPILDHKLVEWMSCLPPHYKLRGKQGKYLFKKALHSYLPDNILYRQKKGFGVPIASWFRGPLRGVIRKNILGNIMAEMDIFNMKFLSELVDEHLSGKNDNSTILWSLLMFESFYRNVFNK